MKEINYFRYILESVIQNHGIESYIPFNLSYEYKLNDEYRFAFSFDELIEDIVWIFEDDLEEYNFDFSEFRDQYSKQEMNLINLLIEQLKKDRKELNSLYTKLE